VKAPFSPVEAPSSRVEAPSSPVEAPSSPVEAPSSPVKTFDRPQWVRSGLYCTPSSARRNGSGPTNSLKRFRSVPFES
jgi:hypothetical protein